MALNCSISLDRNAYAAGQQPLKCYLTVYNPNASALVLTAAVLRVEDWNNARNRLPANVPQMPYDDGVSTLIPALGTVVFGPFNITVALPANVNAFIDPPPATFENPRNPQLSLPPSLTCRVGCVVYASDRSANEAAPAGFLLSYGNPPPSTYQGGFAVFSEPNNAGNFFSAFI